MSALSKAPNQKLKLLYLRQYLESNTDDEHPVSTEEIISYLEKQGVSAERKSIYSDIEALRNFGVDVNAERSGNKRGWYVGEREFQLAELRLLVDSIQSSRFITHKKSLDLISKIEHLTSTYQAKELHRQVWVKNRIKTMNESIYYIVDDLHAAIEGDRRIRFHYIGYDAHGKRIRRRDGAWYNVSPYALLWDDENYYLVGYDSDRADIRHFRVDKIDGLEVTEEKRDGREAFQAIDMSTYTDAHFGMFSGTAERVRLECRSTLSGAVIDRFGADTILVPADREGYFTVTVPVVVSEPFLGWICGFAGGIRIIAPDSAVERMKEHLKKLNEAFEI